MARRRSGRGELPDTPWDPEPEERLRRVRRTTLFQALPEDVARTLTKNATPLRLRRDEPLWRKGSAGTMAFVWAGWLEVRRDDVVLGVQRKGAFFGLSALLDEPHTADVVGGADSTRCLVFDAQALRRELLHRPESMLAALGNLLGLVSRLNEQQTLYRRRAPATERIVYHLRELTRDREFPGQSLGAVNITQEELARLAGCSKRTVNVVLSELEAAGAVEVGYSRLTVLDLEAAESVVGKEADEGKEP